jgi:hypothetical protein
MYNDSTKRNDWTVLALYQHGSVLQSNAFLKGENIHHKPIRSFHSFSLEFLWQKTGKELWEQLYNYPRYGIGIYNARFIGTSELGSPVVLYGILEIPVVRWGKLSLKPYVAAGFAFNWESFGEDRFNIVMGAEESFFCDGGISLEYNLNPELLLAVGGCFTHFSNGALKAPNDGVNLIGPKISLGYNFNNDKAPYFHQQVPVFQKKSEFFISFFSGWKDKIYKGPDTILVTKNRSVIYSIYGLSLAFNRQISYKSKFGIGIMAGYYGAANSSIRVVNDKLVDNNASLREGFELSIFPSYELVIDRLSMLFQPAFYLHRSNYPNRAPGNYQRIGLKYNVVKDLYLGILLHASRFNTSDYIELTAGYRFRL